MKTTHSPESINQFLVSTEQANPATIQQMNEGHVTQALSFDTLEGEPRVLRIAGNDADFKADQYAAQHFGQDVPVPEVVEIGTFDDHSFFCISKRVEGETTDALTKDQIHELLPVLYQTLAKVAQADISGTTGYGNIDTTTGNAPHHTWKARLEAEVNDGRIAELKSNARNIGLDTALVDDFMAQFHKNLPYASEARRLVHGDPGFDNMMVKDGHVTAVIDWSHMSYGDWLYDFAWLDFWWPGRFGDVADFASQAGLEADHIPERMALYYAVLALTSINSADRFKNHKVVDWLQNHATTKVISV